MLISYSINISLYVKIYKCGSVCKSGSVQVLKTLGEEMIHTAR